MSFRNWAAGPPCYPLPVFLSLLERVWEKAKVVSEATSFFLLQGDGLNSLTPTLPLFFSKKKIHQTKG